VPLGEDGPHNTSTISEGIEVAGSVYSRVLEAWDLGDDEIRLGGTNVNQRFDLKTVAPEQATVRRKGGRSV
jgi:hypothetical protein